MFDDTLNVLFSWAGTHTKASFSLNKNILDAILTAVRSKDSKFTLNDLSKFFQEHLKQAKSRLERNQYDTKLNMFFIHVLILFYF